MPKTVPNQRMIQVHREKTARDFLGIKNENWQAAARDLGPTALLLYLYFAANKDNYSFALSPAAIKNQIGMARSTYNDQFHKLVEKGYLVQRNGNTYDFYEIPNQVQLPADEKTAAGQDAPPPVYSSPMGSIEINNKYGGNNGINKQRVEQAPHAPRANWNFENDWSFDDF